MPGWLFSWGFPCSDKILSLFSWAAILTLFVVRQFSGKCSQITSYSCCAICSLTTIIMSSLNFNMLSCQTAPTANVLLQDWKSCFEFSHHSTWWPLIQLRFSAAGMGEVALIENGKSFLPESLRSVLLNWCLGISRCHQPLQCLSASQIKPILTSTSRNRTDFSWKRHTNIIWNTCNSVVRYLSTFNRVKIVEYPNFIFFPHFPKLGSESSFLMLAIFREFCCDPVFWHIWRIVGSYWCICRRHAALLFQNKTSWEIVECLKYQK